MTDALTHALNGIRLGSELVRKAPTRRDLLAALAYCIANDAAQFDESIEQVMDMVAKGAHIFAELSKQQSVS